MSRNLLLFSLVTMTTEEMVVLALCFAEVCGNLFHSCMRVEKLHWIDRPPILSKEGNNSLNVKHLTPYCFTIFDLY